MVRTVRAQAVATALVLAAVACGIELQTGPGVGEDGGTTPPPATSSGVPATSSGTAGEGGTSSSSGTPAVPDADVPDAAPHDPCTGPFTLDSTNIASPPSACDRPESDCQGTATLDGDQVRLTSFAASTENSTGVFWRKLGLGRNARFTLSLRVSTRQPDDGGIQGHGFAFAFVQSDADPAAFPTARVGLPAYLGVNVLSGFHGAAAYVKTYDGGTGGVFALRTSQIPSADPERLDAWDGPIGNTETFGRTDATYLQFDVRFEPAKNPVVTMSRFDTSAFQNGRLVQTVTVPLPAMDRFDYVGIAAARGDDLYSQSAHRLESLALSCPTGP